MPFVYEHGTHFVLPESLFRMALPVGLKFVLRFIFRAAKEYPDACEATRISNAVNTGMPSVIAATEV